MAAAEARWREGGEEPKVAEDGEELIAVAKREGEPEGGG